MYFEVQDTESETNHLNQGENFTCFEEIETWIEWIEKFYFWIKGVLTIFVASIGILANITSYIVLKKMKTNRPFDKLLMSLGG